MKKLILVFLLFISTFLSCDFEADIVVKVEDKLYLCNDCEYQFRKDSSDYNKTCPKCGSKNIEIIEE